MKQENKPEDNSDEEEQTYEILEFENSIFSQVNTTTTPQHQEGQPRQNVQLQTLSYELEQWKQKLAEREVLITASEKETMFLKEKINQLQSENKCLNDILNKVNLANSEKENILDNLQTEKKEWISVKENMIRDHQDLKKAFQLSQKKIDQLQIEMRRQREQKVQQKEFFELQQKKLEQLSEEKHKNISNQDLERVNHLQNIKKLLQDKIFSLQSVVNSQNSEIAALKENLLKKQNEWIQEKEHLAQKQQKLERFNTFSSEKMQQQTTTSSELVQKPKNHEEGSKISDQKLFQIMEEKERKHKAEIKKLSQSFTIMEQKKNQTIKNLTQIIDSNKNNPKPDQTGDASRFEIQELTIEESKLRDIQKVELQLSISKEEIKSKASRITELEKLLESVTQQNLRLRGSQSNPHKECERLREELKRIEVQLSNSMERIKDLEGFEAQARIMEARVKKYEKENKQLIEMNENLDTDMKKLQVQIQGMKQTEQNLQISQRDNERLQIKNHQLQAEVQKKALQFEQKDKKYQRTKRLLLQEKKASQSQIQLQQSKTKNLIIKKNQLLEKLEQLSIEGMSAKSLEEYIFKTINLYKRRVSSTKCLQLNSQISIFLNTDNENM